MEVIMTGPIIERTSKKVGDFVNGFQKLSKQKGAHFAITATLRPMDGEGGSMKEEDIGKIFELLEQATNSWSAVSDWHLRYRLDFQGNDAQTTRMKMSSMSSGVGLVKLMSCNDTETFSCFTSSDLCVEMRVSRMISINPSKGDRISTRLVIPSSCELMVCKCFELKSSTIVGVSYEYGISKVARGVSVMECEKKAFCGDMTNVIEICADVNQTDSELVSFVASSILMKIQDFLECIRGDRMLFGNKS
jgi:Asp-tRNA(Asn)/Glu-tRNA(Gln) amidotransferase C subunit